MPENHRVVIIGAGQAGLCLSNELTCAGTEHVILEQGKIGEAWRRRWDGFCLVLPNWTIRLSGRPYSGPDPDGYMRRDDIIRYLEDYAKTSAAPVLEGVSVTAVKKEPGEGFTLETSAGDIMAQDVVIASGGYQKPNRPPRADQFPESLTVLDVDQYRRPDALPPGNVLVIGSGQSGCQIAEDLATAGRGVYLSCGKAGWLPRRIEGRDVAAWLEGTSFWNATMADLPGPRGRLSANPQLSGRDGGHDLHYRTLQKTGVHLLGHFADVKEGKARFLPDLAECVAWGDARYHELYGMIRTAASARGERPPKTVDPPPFSADTPESIGLGGFGAVVVTSGFRPDYSWAGMPEAFDDLGFPIQRDGSSTVVAGLHFMGVHFQRNRASATLYGVGEDAAVLSRTLTS